MSQQCKWIYNKGKHKDKQCEAVTKSETGFCGRHKARGIKKENKVKGAEKISADSIFSDDAKPPSPNKKKQKSSCWMITINSQKNYDNLSDEDKKLFKKFGDFIMNEEMLKKYYLSDTTSDDINKNITSLKVSHYYEVGDEQNRLHLHGLIQLEHTGYFKLFVNRIREFAKKTLGCNIYLSAPVQSDPIKAYEYYIQKQQNSNKINTLD